MRSRFSSTLGAVWLARHRPASIGLLCLIVLVVAFALPSLRFDNDIERGLSSGGPNLAAFRQLAESFETRTRPIAILVEAEGTFTGDEFALLQDFSLDLALLEPVVQVISPFDLRYPPTHPDTPDGRVLDPALPAASLYSALDSFERDNPNISSMIAPDRASLLLSVLPTAGLSDAAVNELLGDIRSLSDQYSQNDLRVYVTGEDAIALSIVNALIDDVAILNVVGALIAFILALVLFRDIRWAIVVFVPAVLAALFCLALFPLLGFPMTVLSVILPVLVLVLALADACHLVFFVREHAHDGAERAARAVAPANALTSITTAAGFAAIAVTDFEQFTELAVVGAASVLSAYWIVTAGVAALTPIAAGRQRASSAFGLGIPATLIGWPIKWPGRVLAVAGLLALIGLATASQTTPWFPLYQYLPEGNDTRYAHRTIEKSFGGYLPLWFEMDANEDADETYRRVRAVTDAVSAAAPDMPIVSAATLARWAGQETAGPDERLIKNVPSAILSQLQNADGSVARIAVLVPEPMHDTRTMRRHDRIVDAAMQSGAERAIGLPVLLREDALQLVLQLGYGLAIACLLATGLVAGAFRSARLFPLLFVPNFLPLIAATAALPLINAGQISPAAMLALTVAFCVAVDDSIHFLNRYRLEREGNAGVEAALETAISTTGRVMLVTTVLISAGIASTFSSDFQTVRLFGTLVVIIFITALIADLLVLPAMIRLRWWS
ncbi:efflux RND transporter permease subunit [Hoeflea prorocentri]|uniref:MMPL family transporter n=1 Tax=Hoeflea prorocentri TaxID=1922333 RepID=A0A9X3ZHR2_9HYPH|nr:MMPL family transporter [Hoeflea prorocentri]MCY6382122.1 MMPL family transporter [Hoeflea prorocentri]MDA5399922.1 MMPL family transporter [Hoeflea prorocentri]